MTGMDQSESSKIVRGRGRNKRKWTGDEDEELVKALCEVSLDPRFKVEGGGFKNCYSQGIESLLAQRLPGRGIKASPHVDSRLKVLKRKFYSIKDMLASPGFSWDGTRNMIQCEKERYDEYCKENPRARGMYGIPFPHFDTFDAIYGKDRTAREGAEVSEAASADMENGNTSGAGDEDRISTGPSGRSLDTTSRCKRQKKCNYGGKRKRIESNCPPLDMFKDIRGQYHSVTQHVSMMAEAMDLFKDVHGHFQNVVQHSSAMAAAMEGFKDAHGRFQRAAQNVSTAAAAMERFKDAHDHFQSATQNGSTIAAVMECDTDMQQTLTPEEPQRDPKVRAIAEMQKLGFTGGEVVNAASVFAKEPNQMEMFLALPEIYKRGYILQMLNAGQSLQF
ncbi:uncharacterized protein LOC100836505 isoform X1 [Brachypodium distachyon]|uniref:Uncharacterized protein n=2 Tax=Brachypodium distachyon TaxID=15368 RepID=I1GRQ6_BRADI|nr:uncharacterized protein LOC100836505 isoform X1 [Brachypodium distachyon]KQK14920.1 hypothetical protein BRADI_1g19520v3 [Brachypodium distachyon]|eukprot:XP_003559880.2 uncharacterized protein LOC100836505 isoform X1 [Brachypodium distachyon]